MAASVPGLLKLSNELLREILDYIEADPDKLVNLDRRAYLSQESFKPPAFPTQSQAHDIANFRLTCSRLSEVGAIHQFARVTTRFSGAGFRRLENIASRPRIAKHVKKFSYVVPYFYAEGLCLSISGCRTTGSCGTTLMHESRARQDKGASPAAQWKPRRGRRSTLHPQGRRARCHCQDKARRTRARTRARGVCLTTACPDPARAGLRRQHSAQLHPPRAKCAATNRSELGAGLLAQHQDSRNSPACIQVPMLPILFANAEHAERRPPCRAPSTDALEHGIPPD